jgi:LuxR family maltose regulon positive regulatory protein
MKIASLSAELQHDPEHLLRNMHGGTRSIARYLKEVVLDRAGRRFSISW